MICFSPNYNQSADIACFVFGAYSPAYVLSCQKASEVRRVVRVLFVVLYEVIDMFIFLIFYIGIWAVMATYLFGPNPQDNNFANLGDSFTQLFVLITTCNYPSVMMPAYTKHQASFFFFFIFIVIGIYFILNLILAIVFRVYTAEERNKFHKRFLRQRAAVRFAYSALMQSCDGEDGITWDAFNECMKVYDRFSKQKQRRIMFCALKMNPVSTEAEPRHLSHMSSSAFSCSVRILSIWHPHPRCLSLSWI
jgi:two pore calcium channel protein 1